MLSSIAHRTKEVRGISNNTMADLIGTPQQLTAAREFAGFSVRGLADEVSRELRKDRRKTPMTISRSTISNLETGAATRVHHRRASAIERVLKLPPGHLFRVEAFNVHTNTARQTA